MQIIIQKGCGLMTVQQQVCARIINMSDEGAAFIEQVINNMNPVFFIGKNNLKSICLRIKKNELSSRHTYFNLGNNR